MIDRIVNWIKDNWGWVLLYSILIIVFHFSQMGEDTDVWGIIDGPLAYPSGGE